MDIRAPGIRTVAIIVALKRLVGDSANPGVLAISIEPWGLESSPRSLIVFSDQPMTTMTVITMDPLDELRIQYRRLKSRHLEVTEAHRADQARKLLGQLRDFFRDNGFEVSIADEVLKSVQATRVVMLRADGDEEIRVGEFLGFTFTDSLRDNKRRRIIARLQPGALPEHAPIDVNTRESIQAQIDYMEQLLAEGARALRGFEVKETMTMANYREPEPDGNHLAFTSLEEAVAYLLAEL